MKLWPSRTQSKNNVVANLDALIVESVEFTLHGKDHKIKPITTEEFLKFVTAYSKLVEYENKKEITPDEFVDVYYAIISSVCDTVSRKDIQKMTTAQVAALFQLIISTVTGETQGDQKKTLLRAKQLASSVVQELTDRN